MIPKKRRAKAEINYEDRRDAVTEEVIDPMRAFSPAP